MSELDMEVLGLDNANSVPDTRERKNAMGMFMSSTGETGVFQRIDGTMIYRDAQGNETGLGGGAYVPQDGIKNPVDQVVVGIVGSEDKPIPLFLTGPPVGSEEDYLFAIATGDPEYRVLFMVSRYGEVTISPSDPSDEALCIESAATTDASLVRVTSGLGEIFQLGADGAFRLMQPGVGPVIGVTSEGDVSLGKEDGLSGFFGGTPVAKPEVPASPTEQDIVDVLVLLGLVSQAS